jgi:hypothetical protein
MKYILSLLLLFAFSAADLFAQKQTFDLITYTPPKGWKKQPAENAVQFSKEDAAKGTYCLITVYKAVPGTADSKENFDLAWASVVKEMVTVTSPPEMQPVATENGWEVQSGYAPFENDGNKGVVVLATSSAFEKMLNIIILTNTDVYEKNITDFLGSITISKPAAKKNIPQPAGQTGTKKTVSPVNESTKASPGFAFTTTNFDDGWTSTVQEDWVQVIKGDVKVLLHYPGNKINAANTDLDVMCAAAWNALVAPRYSNMENYQVTPGVLEYQRPYFVQANLTDNVTGKKVFVALFKKGNSGWIEIITTDKNSFIQNFGLDISKIDYYVDSKIWEPLLKLSNYNKFAVAASDFKGKWTNKFTGMQQYVNVYTGADAGMSTHSSVEIFEFGAGNSYKWELKVASGFVGNIKFDGAKSSGKLSVLNNWQVHFTEIEKKARTYNAYFSCVKGTRLLWLQDTGYGDYSSFGKVE